MAGPHTCSGHGQECCRQHRHEVDEDADVGEEDVHPERVNWVRHAGTALPLDDEEPDADGVSSHDGQVGEVRAREKQEGHGDALFKADSQERSDGDHVAETSEHTQQGVEDTEILHDVDVRLVS